MVGIVKQQQCRGLLPRRLIHDGAVAAGGKVDVELAVLVQGGIKKRHAQAVWPGRILGLGAHRELGDLLALRVQLRGEGVWTPGAQPCF